MSDDYIQAMLEELPESKRDELLAELSGCSEDERFRTVMAAFSTLDGIDRIKKMLEGLTVDERLQRMAEISEAIGIVSGDLDEGDSDLGIQPEPYEPS